jgi:hypothetical protein
MRNAIGQAKLEATFNILEAQGPLSALGVAYHLGTSVDRALFYLRALRRQGRLTCTDQGQRSRWCLPSELEAASLLGCDERRKYQNAVRNRKRKALNAADDTPAEWLAPRRTIVPAHEAIPLGAVGPASIFHLGAFL